MIHSYIKIKDYEKTIYSRQRVMDQANKDESWVKIS